MYYLLLTFEDYFVSLYPSSLSLYLLLLRGSDIRLDDPASRRLSGCGSCVVVCGRYIEFRPVYIYAAGTGCASHAEHKVVE
jgi:hypothetical protein